MLVETHDSFRNPKVTAATRIVIRDGLHNNIVAVIVEPHPGRVVVHNAGDDKFQEQLRILGINEVVLVTPAVLPGSSGIRI